MAIMIPTFPYGFKKESREDEMFESLSKLPDDYFVFYSYKLVNLVNQSIWKEKEIDFVIYNRNLGLMFVEAKAGKVWCDHGIWRYANGDEMKDPFKQADDGRWVFHQTLDKMTKHTKNPIIKRCKFHFAVWFPSISKRGLENIRFPQDADPNVVLTAEDLDNPRESIERIFSYDVINENVQTNLSDSDHKFLLDEFLCPSFEIIPPKSYELDYKKKRFDQLIIEQSNILNYLEYQRNAVINGVAGTGKTMIAVEKARRHSQQGETVLFLCFNNKLKEHLERAYPFDHVSYYTIDGFACKMCSTAVASFDYLANILLEFDEKENTFPYQHIIVDEGQDFGQERMHTDEIFELLEDIALKSDNGTFYVFYDRLQLIQSEQLPSFIENADCRLTLYKNCRNTRKIAETSFRPLQLEKVPKLFDAAMPGDHPQISFCSDADMKSVLEKVIKASVDQKMDDVQILSCASSGNSRLSSFVTNGYYPYMNRKFGFTTVRKFKGLEADHIILVDVDKDTIMNQSMLFYVGSSRAKFKLSIIANLDDNDCTEVVKSFGTTVKRKNPKDSLTRILGCKSF